MKNFLGAGSASAIVAGLLLSIGGSGQALAQQVSNLPVVQAVVKTAPAQQMPVAASPRLSADAAVAREASWRLPR